MRIGRRGRREGNAIQVIAITAGNHEGEILNDIGLIQRDRIHVHGRADDGDGIVRAERGCEIDVLHIVHYVRADVVISVHGHAVGRIGGSRKVIAIEYVAGVQVGHHEVEVVHKLDGSGGISRRIGPRQRHAEHLTARNVIRHRDEIGAAITGLQRIRRALIHEINGQVIRRRGGVGQRQRNRVGNKRQAPAFKIDRIRHGVGVTAERPRAIDQHGLHQGRARQDL